MSPRSIIDDVLLDPPVLRDTTTVAEAVRAIVASDLPALPVVDDRDRYRGIFGEREFIGAVFPGYLKTLGYAGFAPRSIEDALEKRSEAATEAIGDHLNSEHIDVPADASDIQVAETFLHHRVLVVPVTDRGRVVGLVTRAAFFRSLADRFLGRQDG